MLVVLIPDQIAIHFCRSVSFYRLSLITIPAEYSHFTMGESSQQLNGEAQNKNPFPDATEK